MLAVAVLEEVRVIDFLDEGLVDVADDARRHVISEDLDYATGYSDWQGIGEEVAGEFADGAIEGINVADELPDVEGLSTSMRRQAAWRGQTAKTNHVGLSFFAALGFVGGKRNWNRKKMNWRRMAGKIGEKTYV